MIGPDFSHREEVLTTGKCSTGEHVGHSNHRSGGRMSPPGAACGLLRKAALNWETMCLCGCRFAVYRRSQRLGGVSILIFIGTLVDLLFHVSIAAINTCMV